MRKLFILLALLAIPVVVHAQDASDRPLVSASRLQLGGGINHEWFSGSADSPVITIKKEFTLGLYASYNMVPQVDIIAFSKRGLDSKIWNSALGLRITIFSGVK